MDIGELDCLKISILTGIFKGEGIRLEAGEDLVKKRNIYLVLGVRQMFMYIYLWSADKP